MYIDEIFGPALQGEGSHMGVPSVFVRTGGCNLKCEGFGCTLVSPLDNKTVIKGCDSIHAVNSKHFKHTWTEYNNFMGLVLDIENCFGNYKNAYSEKVDIIFTGGEPLIHYKEDVIIQTIEYFTSRGHRVFFETNGTIDIDFEDYPIYKKVHFSMSVKMSCSGEPESRRWKPNTVNEYLKNTEGSYFKFVLNKSQIESKEAEEVFSFLEQVPTFGVVYCMPMGETSKEVESNSLSVYQFCLENGFRYSDRIHIRVFNDLRGV